MEQNNIDKLFNDHLAEHSAAPSDALWDKIETEMGPEDDGAAIYFPRRGLAILLLLTIISGLFFWRTSKLDREKLAQAKEATAPHAEQANVQYSSPEESGTAYATDAAKVAQNEANSQALTDAADDEYYIAPSKRNNATNGPTSPIQTQVPSSSEQELSAKEWVSTTSGHSIGLPEQSTSLGEGNSGIEGMGLLINAYSEHDDMVQLHYRPIQIDPIRNNSARKNHDSIPRWINICGGIRYSKSEKWSAGITAFQNSTFRRIVAENGEGETQKSNLNRMEKPGTSPGIRGFIAYDISKRLSLAIGLEYSQWNQSGNYEISYPQSIVEFNSMEQFANVSYSTELETATGISQLQLQGIIDTETLPEPASLGSMPVFPNAQVSIEERIDWVSVPLSLRYQTQLGRLGVYGGAGLSYDRMIKARTVTQLSDEFSNSISSAPEHSNTDLLSTHATAGILYRISERTMIQIGPRIKSWLAPIYESDQIRSYPYSGSIELGVEINL